MIAIKNDCALKSPFFCVPRVFHPRHSAIYQASAAYGAALMGDSCSLIKTPRMAFAIRGRFLPLVFSSALSAWFLLPQIPPICTDFTLRSVGASPCLVFFDKSKPHGQFHIPHYKPPPHYIIRCAPKPKARLNIVNKG